MRILLADAFPQPHLQQLADRGHHCVYEPDLTSGELAEHLADCTALVVRSTRVPAEVLDSADSLRLVIRAGSGTNTIDCAAASRNGIAVCNVPGKNAIAVAELAFGLLLCIDRQIADAVADLRAGWWNKKKYSHARGICGRRIGVIGLGQIGLAFAERAAAFGAEVRAVAKPGRSSEVLQRAAEIGIDYVPDLPALVRGCDVLSLHLPAAAETRHLLDRRLLAEVQPGTIILNTARSDLIDEDALVEAMDTKDVRVGLDVFAGEPESGRGRMSSRLATHPNVYGTHHIGASTEQAQHAIAAEVVRMIDAFPEGTVLHCVNQEVLGTRELIPVETP
ncbi:NAD(P)-dependent oxidoreductase [Saccharopolyspora rectivirgula]|jgi:D-3-phosphoglycerate dehydrogenase|uniref:2-hydroxyacid dehydrogenase n=1 Tax=Saccharopolyspora rectivirgula TaxID=28042 RepID=A0A073B012_9PSEU|nr:NAD(P)-dependent oxidoreductase [Saccharopolyspora rectivirgula]KEI44980.1 2-hydroxyacid dehydrogenase [Saccharopolyspora rectivirgula]